MQVIFIFNIFIDHIWNVFIFYVFTYYVSDFDWIALQEQRLRAPFQPQIRNREDLSNFEDAGDLPAEPPAVAFDGVNWDLDFVYFLHYYCYQII